MPPVPRSGAADTRALETLLEDLGPRLRRGEAPQDAPGFCPTGWPEADRLLGGGFPRGRVSEVAGPASSGRTSLALALLAATTRCGEFAAWIDARNAFDPPSAEAAGVDLSRVLWVRAPERRAFLRSAERLVEARGFALVLLDFTEDEARPSAAHAQREARRASPLRGLHSSCGLPSSRGLPPSVWPRLSRGAAGTQTALVVIGTRRLAGAFSSLTLELDPAEPRFSGAPLLFEGLEGRMRLVRNRTGPSDRSALLSVPVAPHRAA